MREKDYFIEDYKCPGCGNIAPVIRKLSARRGKDHLKLIFCPYCNKVANHRIVETYFGKHWGRK